MNSIPDNIPDPPHSLNSIPGTGVIHTLHLLYKASMLLTNFQYITYKFRIDINEIIPLSVSYILSSE